MASRKRKSSGRGRHFKTDLNEGKQNCERFRQAQLSNRERKSADKDLLEYAGHQSGRIFGGLIVLIALAIGNIKEQLAFLKKEIAKLEKKISRTEDQNRMAATKENKTPIREWEGKDFALYVAYWCLMLITIGAGGGCLYANAITTIPAYIESPKLAWFLVFLPVATTVATKQFYEDCETDKGKRNFSRFMAGFGLISFTVWVCVLAMMFIGDTGEMDLDQLDQPNYLDGFFVVSQVIAEVFVSGSIYIALSKIYTKYNPETFEDSKKLLKLNSDLDQMREKQKALILELSEKQKELTQLEADKASFVCEEMALFQAQRARLEASAPDMGFFQNQMEDKMKKYLVITVVAIAALFLIGTKALAGDYIIGMSPNLRPTKAETQVKNVSNFLLDNLKPGDSAVVFNAYTNESLGEFKVPNRPAYRHKKVRMKLKPIRKGLLALRRFGKQAHLPEGAEKKVPEGLVSWPDFLRFVAENYPAREKTDVILFGSPFYVSTNPRMKDFSMLGGAVPGDGHLIASRSQTPFGTAGSEGLLSNFRVHFGLPNVTWKESDQHAHHVQRFISLFVERMGGELVSFTHDLPTLFRRVKEKAPAPNVQYALAPTGTLAMNSYVYADIAEKEVSGGEQPVGAPEVTTPAPRAHVEEVPSPPVVAQSVPIHERPISQKKVSPATARSAQLLEVGLSWVCPHSRCDYDIHAQAHPGAQVLNFSHTSTPEGTYFKDFTTSPRLTNNAYETIAFKVPVDLTRMKLAINFYGGEVPQPNQVELRIAINGRTYMKRYLVHALRGNTGKGFQSTFQTGKPANPNWLVIDPLEVIGLDRAQTLTGR